MDFNSTVNSAVSKLVYWSSKNPAATRLVMVTLPMAIGVVSVLIIRQPPCGTGTGGGTC